MVVLLAIVLYVVLVVGGIRFFRQVHRWVEQASRLWNEELVRLESKQRTQPEKRRSARASRASVTRYNSIS